LFAKTCQKAPKAIALKLPYEARGICSSGRRSFCARGDLRGWAAKAAAGGCGANRVAHWEKIISYAVVCFSGGISA
jgi:hypothetical protein